MAKVITLYHGSNQIVSAPEFGKGRERNDFGLGFYCTKNIELAKEWAVSSLANGFSNEYALDVEYLKVLNLNSSEWTILNWIAILLQHRVFPVKTPVARKARQHLIDNFYVNVNAYDLVIGYRADDSYFDYAEAFVNNGISVGQLARAMKLGKLGEQIVIKSKYAFSLLKFKGFVPVEKDRYYILRKKRDTEANEAYMKILEEDDDGIFVNDIVKGAIRSDDPRIPRNLPQ